MILLYVLGKVLFYCRKEVNISLRYQWNQTRGEQNIRSTANHRPSVLDESTNGVSSIGICDQQCPVRAIPSLQKRTLTRRIGIIFMRIHGIDKDAPKPISTPMAIVLQSSLVLVTLETEGGWLLMNMTSRFTSGVHITKTTGSCIPTKNCCCCAFTVMKDGQKSQSRVIPIRS